MTSVVMLRREITVDILLVRRAIALVLKKDVVIHLCMSAILPL